MPLIENPFLPILDSLERLHDKVDAIERNNAKSPETQTPRFLNVKQAALYTGYSEYTIYRLTSEKGIPHSKRGRKVIFERDALDAWMLEYKQA